MDISLFLAKVLGLYLLIKSIALALNIRHIERTMNELLKNRSALLLMEIMATLVGLVIVVSHNDWSDLTSILISALGWIYLIKGASFLFFPKAMIAAVRQMNVPAYYIVGGLITFLIGLYLAYAGFVEPMMLF